MSKLPNISGATRRTIDHLLTTLAAERGYREDAVGDGFGAWLYDLCEAVRQLQAIEKNGEGGGEVALTFKPGAGPVSCDLDVLVQRGDAVVRHSMAFAWYRGIVGDVLRAPATGPGTSCNLVADEENLTVIITGIGHIRAAAQLKQGTKIE